MADMNVHIKCAYCRQVAKRKYHNTVYPYCGNCNRDIDGEKIYTCNYCGLDEPSNRMSTEQACMSCAEREDISAFTAADRRKLEQFIAMIQRSIPDFQDTEVEYRRVDANGQGKGSPFNPSFVCCDKCGKGMSRKEREGSTMCDFCWDRTTSEG